MNDLNSLHPLVRYGIAAALIRIDDLNTDINKRSDLWILAKKALEDGLNDLVLAPYPAKDGKSIFYKTMLESQLKSKKNAENGYFISPHVLTNQNSAGIIGETEKLIALLKKKDEGKNYELKRSYAPMIAKMNAGNKSMSNPKIELLEAAFTCVATLTALKPAAYVKISGNKFANAGIIPDLPLIDEATGERPMVDFIDLFKEIIAHGVGANAYTKEPTKERKFPRPDIFQGNYPNRPKTFGIGSVALVAAIGQWAKEHQIIFGKSQKVLELLENCPIYIVSYEDTRQERFGHHLVELSMSGELYSILTKLPRVSLIGVDDGKKYSDPKWQLFTMHFDQFLLFYNESSWQNFLSYRATYPIEFFQLLKSYFMQTGKYSEAIIDSAVAYGKSLNRAAYLAAKQEVSADEKGSRSGARSLNEYKHRVLLQLESIINSAENGCELVARLNSQVGRLTMQDVANQSETFLKEVVNNSIEIKDAQHLMTAFMRLSTYDPNKSEPEKPDSEKEATTSDEGELSFLG
jgi:hypothetical protein